MSFFQAEDFKGLTRKLYPDDGCAEYIADRANARRDAEVERLRAENATLQSKHVNGIETIVELRAEMKRMQYVIDQGVCDVAEIRRLREALKAADRQNRTGLAGGTSGDVR